jgi:uncharacterized membrane-anchored protein
MWIEGKRIFLSCRKSNSNTVKQLCSLLLLVATYHTVAAQSEDSLIEAEMAQEYALYYSYIDSLEQHLDYETGEIVIGANLAKIDLPDGYRYLNPENTDHIVTETWGNPPTESLGMIVPVGINPYSISGWGVIISYEQDGHIEDEEAANLNFEELLATMKEDVERENQERIQKGYDTYSLKGWAEDPFYDNQEHKIFWALDLHFGMEEEDYPGTLNYNIRVLGREGVLVMNAVSGMEQLDDVREHMKTLLPAIAFVPGNRYEDYDSSTDQLAGYGVGALVAGKIVSKTGILTAVTTFVVKGWKFLLVIFAALVAMLRKLIISQRRTRRSESA